MFDASITLAWCFEDQATLLSQAVLDQLANDRGLVPELWPFEVANVLALARRRGRLTRAQASLFIRLIDQLPITVEELGRDQVLTTVLTLSESSGLTVYDASYLALATQAGVPLATRINACSRPQPPPESSSSERRHSRRTRSSLTAGRFRPSLASPTATRPRAYPGSDR
ncbi:MAG: type II toxin-antitoxin system VapC family toxin [Candidatus Dormiibacterota bacterium]